MTDGGRLLKPADLFAYDIGTEWGGGVQGVDGMGWMGGSDGLGDGRRECGG